jgi:hypothetical protein
MVRVRVFEDGPPGQGIDRRPWVWRAGRAAWDPELGETHTPGQWQRQPADPEDPPALIDD